MAILNMNAHAYRKYISESAKPVLMEFSAPWCGYCRRLEPALELTVQQYEGEIIFGQSDRIYGRPRYVCERKYTKAFVRPSRQ